MKKIFIVILPGAEEKMLVADSLEEAFERRSEVDHSYEYLPVHVKELEIEGFEIQVKPIEAKQEEEPAAEVESPIDKPPEQPKQKKSSKK